MPPRYVGYEHETHARELEWNQKLFYIIEKFIFFFKEYLYNSQQSVIPSVVL